MVRKIPQHVQNVPRVPLPSLILDHHKTGHIGIESMFVNGYVFLVTMSFNIKVSSIMNMQGRGATEAANGLKTTISAFTAHKISIEMIVGANEFETLRKALITIHVEMVGSDKHDGHVERLIYIVKDRTRCDFQNIPYKKFSKLMVVSSLEANITWLNVFPKKNGISKTLSPSAIVLGTTQIYDTRTTLQPGSYVHCNIK